MYLRAHPVAVGAGLTTSVVDVGLDGGAIAGGDGSGGPFESCGGVVAGAAGAAAWATTIAARPCGVAEAIWENATSAIEAVIVQQIFPMSLLAD
jgi:hypothetical protein